MFSIRHDYVLNIIYIYKSNYETRYFLVCPPLLMLIKYRYNGTRGPEYILLTLNVFVIQLGASE